MTILAVLIPVSLLLGAFGLIAFIWSLRDRQYDDLEGDQYRALFRDK
ncbi:MAG: cbb3-type cytochrome oxidase assembly protein CcoS [Pseudomonadota bacterium]